MLIGRIWFPTDRLIWDRFAEGSAGSRQLLLPLVRRRPLEITPAILSDFPLSQRGPWRKEELLFSSPVRTWKGCGKPMKNDSGQGEEREWLYWIRLWQCITLNGESGLGVMFESSNSVTCPPVASILYFWQRNFSLKWKMLEITATTLCHSDRWEKIPSPQPYQPPQPWRDGAAIVTRV